MLPLEMMIAETFSQSVGQTPMHHEAVGIQAQHDVANRGTEMTPMRYEKERRDMETAIHEKNTPCIIKIRRTKYAEEAITK